MANVDDSQLTVYRRMALHLFSTKSIRSESFDLYSCEVIISFVEKLIKHYNYQNVSYQQTQSNILDIRVNDLIVLRCSFYNLLFVDIPMEFPVPNYLNGKIYQNDFRSNRLDNYKTINYYRNYHHLTIVLNLIFNVIETQTNKSPNNVFVLKIIDFVETFLIEILVKLSQKLQQLIYERGILADILVYRNKNKYYFGNPVQSVSDSAITARLEKSLDVCIQFNENHFPSKKSYSYKIYFDGRLDDGCLAHMGGYQSIEDTIYRQRTLYYDSIDHITQRFGQIINTKTFYIHQFLKEFVPSELNFIITMMLIKLDYFDCLNRAKKN